MLLLQDAGAVYPWGVGLSGTQSENGTPSVHSSARDGSEYITETSQDGDEKMGRYLSCPRLPPGGAGAP